MAHRFDRNVFACFVSLIHIYTYLPDGHIRIRHYYYYNNPHNEDKRFMDVSRHIGWRIFRMLLEPTSYPIQTN